MINFKRLVKEKLTLRNCLFLVLIIFILGSSFLTFRRAINEPFHLDETDEALMGLRMSQVGPRVYLPVPEGNMQISHAPLYTFTHALIQKIFGPYEFPLRIYGFAYYILSLFLMLLIVGCLIEDKKLKVPGQVMAAVLYLVNPLLIQHSIVINADNNIQAAAILLFAYFFIRYEKLESGSYIISRLKLALLLALCFWSKEITPAFLAAGLLFYRLIRFEFKKLFTDLFLVCILGFFIFWSTWWLYCFFTKTDVLGFVRFTIINKGARAFSEHYFKIMLCIFFDGMRWHILWVSAFFWIAIGFFAFKRFASLIKEKKIILIDWFFICGFAMWLPYQFFRPNVDMVKYHYPAYIFFIILLSWLFAEALKKKNAKAFFSNETLIIATTGLLILTFYYYKLGDYLLVLWTPLFKHMGYKFFPLYYLPMVLVLVFFIFYRKKNIFSNIVISTIFLIVPVNIGLDLNHARAKYVTVEIWRNYGESGMSQTLDYLKKNVRDDTVTSLRIDLEYYLIERYGKKIKNIRPEKIFMIENDQVVAEIFYSIPVDFLVMDKVSSQMVLTPHPQVIVENFFYLDRVFGDFYIFRRKPGK